MDQKERWIESRDWRISTILCGWSQGGHLAQEKHKIRKIKNSTLNTLNYLSVGCLIWGVVLRIQIADGRFQSLPVAYRASGLKWPPLKYTFDKYVWTPYFLCFQQTKPIERRFSKSSTRTSLWILFCCNGNFGYWWFSWRGQLSCIRSWLPITHFTIWIIFIRFWSPKNLFGLLFQYNRIHSVSTLALEAQISVFRDL